MWRPHLGALTRRCWSPRELAIGTALEMAVAGAVTAVATVFGSHIKDAGDFTTPFIIMAAAYLASTLVYWRVFRPLELSEIEQKRASDRRGGEQETVIGDA